MGRRKPNTVNTGLSQQRPYAAGGKLKSKAKSKCKK